MREEREAAVGSRTLPVALPAGTARARLGRRDGMPQQEKGAAPCYPPLPAGQPKF